jgi:hypothetical protein
MDILDELIHVAVGCREAGVGREEALAAVRDCYDAPWSDDKPPVRGIVERMFARPRARQRLSMAARTTLNHSTGSLMP